MRLAFALLQFPLLRSSPLLRVTPKTARVGDDAGLYGTVRSSRARGGSVQGCCP